MSMEKTQWKKRKNKHKKKLKKATQHNIVTGSNVVRLDQLTTATAELIKSN